MTPNELPGIKELSYLNPYWVIRKLDGLNRIDLSYQCQCKILTICDICDIWYDDKAEKVSRNYKDFYREFDIFVSNSRYVKYSSITYKNQGLDIIVCDFGAMIVFSDVEVHRENDMKFSVLNNDMTNIFSDMWNYLMVFFKRDLSEISSVLFSELKWEDWRSVYSVENANYSYSSIYDLLSLGKEDFLNFYLNAKRCECDDSRYCKIPDEISCRPDEVCTVCKKLSGRRYCEPPFDCECSNYNYLSYLVQSYFPA